MGVDEDATGVTFHAAVSDELSDGIDMMRVSRLTLRMDRLFVCLFVADIGSTCSGSPCPTTGPTFKIRPGTGSAVIAAGGWQTSSP